MLEVRPVVRAVCIRRQATVNSMDVDRAVYIRDRLDRVNAKVMPVVQDD